MSLCLPPRSEYTAVSDEIEPASAIARYRPVKLDLSRSLPITVVTVEQDARLQTKLGFNSTSLHLAILVSASGGA